MADRSRLVFMLDVDNTLIDNDFVKDDLTKRMGDFLRPEDEDRFWDLYEQVRQETDVVDFPHTLERFHEGFKDEPAFNKLCHLLNDYRFDKHLYPRTMEAIHHLRGLGMAVVVSDGDTIFQPRKIAEAGITEAVEGHVFIYTHKEKSIAQVMERCPADRYVMIDDKRRILSTLKRDHATKFSTVHILQGHYAHADGDLQPPPDIELPVIGDILGLTAADFLR
jgi:FMN phosphatase YigB (HAD superfamily)